MPDYKVKERIAVEEVLTKAFTGDTERLPDWVNELGRDGKLRPGLDKSFKPYLRVMINDTPVAAHEGDDLVLDEEGELRIEPKPT